MEAHTPEHTIYLDLDGVIFPYFKETQPEFQAPVSPESELPRQWLNRFEFYYPAITQRLGEIATQGVRILPSSSRSFDLFLYYPSVVKDLGGIERTLVIDTYTPARINLKAEAVLNHWHGLVDQSSEKRGWERHRSMITTPPNSKPDGSRAVWIDDHATPKEVLQLLDDPSIKIISPLGTIGLTMSQLDEAERFLFEV